MPEKSLMEDLYNFLDEMQEKHQVCITSVRADWSMVTQEMGVRIPYRQLDEITSVVIK